MPQSVSQHSSPGVPHPLEPVGTFRIRTQGRGHKHKVAVGAHAWEAQEQGRRGVIKNALGNRGEKKH